MEWQYCRIDVEPKRGDEPFVLDGRALGFDLLSFWRWSGSDLIGNTARGVLAEYIVANALGLAEAKTRIEWDAFDLLTSDEVKIEVKSSSYIQTWEQRKMSKITFGIHRTRKWNPKTLKMEGEFRRQADVYVFCVLAHREQKTLDPLKVEQWEFYILPTDVLDEKCLTQKTIGLERLKSFGATAIAYDHIANHIRNLNLKLR